MTSVQLQIRHILAPTDGSELSIKAGQIAVKWATMHQASITFVYVVDDTVARELAGVAQSVSVGATKRAPAQVLDELELNGQRYLDYLCRMASEAHVKSDCIMCHGVPYEEIANLARDREVDLIVMGQVGSRGSQRIRIGSVAERVIEYAPCPVLVIK